MPLTGVGRLVGELGLDISRFEDGLRRAGSRLENNLKGWEQKTRQVADRVGALGKTLSLRVTAPLVALGLAGLSLVNRLGNAAQEMLALRDAFGLSLDFLQGLRSAAIEAGVPWESVQNVFKRIAELLRDVSSSEDVPQIFKDLGIAIFDADGNMRSMEEIFLEIIESLSQIENPLARAQLGTALFGDEWPRIAPLVAMGREEIEKVIAETDKLPESTIEAAADTTAEWEKLRQRFDDILGKIQATIGKLFAELPKPLQMLIIGLAAFLIIAGPALIIIGQMIEAFTFLLLALKKVGPAFTFLAAHPMILIIGAILATIAAVALLAFKWDEITFAIEERTGKWAPFIIDSLRSLLGPIGGIGIALNDLIVNWDEDWQQLKDIVSSFLDFMEDMKLKLLEIVDGIKGALGSITGGISQGFSLGSIFGNANGTRNFGGGLTLVGERGPELVNLPRGSGIMPSPATMGILNASGGGGNIIIQGDVLDGDHFMRLVGRSGARIISGGGWNKLRRR